MIHLCVAQQLHIVTLCHKFFLVGMCVTTVHVSQCALLLLLSMRGTGWSLFINKRFVVLLSSCMLSDTCSILSMIVYLFGEEGCMCVWLCNVCVGVYVHV